MLPIECLLPETIIFTFDLVKIVTYLPDYDCNTLGDTAISAINQLSMASTVSSIRNEFSDKLVSEYITLYELNVLVETVNI